MKIFTSLCALALVLNRVNVRQNTHTTASAMAVVYTDAPPEAANGTPATEEPVEL